MQPSSPNSKSKEDGNISKMGTVEIDAIQSKPRIQYIEGPKTMTPSLLDLNDNVKTENDYDVITQTFKDKNQSHEHLDEVSKSMRKNTNETFEILSEARRKEPVQDIKKGTRPQVTILKSERKYIRDEEVPFSKTSQNLNLTLQNKLAAKFMNVTMP